MAAISFKDVTHDMGNFPELELHPLFLHGRLHQPDWQNPVRVTSFDVPARWTFTDMCAHEYREKPETLAKKAKMLADLIRRSKNCVAYTGAGISTAAGIDDYASKAKSTYQTAAGKPVLKDWKQARPTYSHRVLTTLYEQGQLKHWIQQNHDSLPQKAGYPQHALNEIHGSLHDPSNPIVPYEGELRPDLFQWMNEWTEQIDLCLALGTSMSGFAADEVALHPATKFADGIGLGIVIINLQQTQYDSRASLRIFEKIDR